MTKAWWKAAGIRALRTFCQTVLAMIPVAVTISEINWPQILSTGLTAAILSMLTSLAGLPEVER